MKYDYLIVGAGFTGAVVAERIANELGKRVLVIDRRAHVGGNAYDYFDCFGVQVHGYGPHIFHTNSIKVRDYLSRFTGWRPYEHRVRGWLDGILVPIPFNFASLEAVFGVAEAGTIIRYLTDEFGSNTRVPVLKLMEAKEAKCREVGEFIFEKVFYHYSLKQWGREPSVLDHSVLARVPVSLSYDDRYFTDTFQAMPLLGYASIFEKLLKHPLVDVVTNTDFGQAEQTYSFGRVVYTGGIDEFFGCKFGPLPYRSLRFDWSTVPTTSPLQSAAQVNFPTPGSEHAYTRMTEFRQLTGQDDISYSTIATEYPEEYISGKNEPYYPIPCADSRALYRRYESEAARHTAVQFAGRLADYTYYNMDQAVARALSLFEKVIKSW